MIKRKTSQEGINLIKSHEGLKLKAYLCPANVWTIGYGHTRTVKQGGLIITEKQAEDLLRSDLEISEASVNYKLKNTEINQNQFDALVSFVFNVGAGAFAKSTLLKKLLSNWTEDEIRHEFSRWNKGGGRVLPGLVKRRQDEADLFFKPVETIGNLDPKEDKRV